MKPGLLSDKNWRWHFCLWALLVALIAVNPIGYVGGGWDDWHYVSAARCWAENGPCLPLDHWAGRWPVFAPTALMFELFGVSRLTLSVWPLIACMVVASLIAEIGNRLFHSPVGWLAAAIFVVTPAFSIQLIGPTAEAIELAFQLAGIILIVAWLDRRSIWAAFASGLSFALAFQVKETSLTAAAIAFVFVMARRPRKMDVMAAAAGFLLPLSIEFLAYLAITGDPLYRRSLSLAHTQIPSTELRNPSDVQGSPIFNKSIIAGWRREPGLHVHWILDGFINLLANAKAGLTLWLAPLGLLVLRPVLTVSERKATLTLLGCAFTYIAILTFFFAIDPKPRMMFAPLAATSTTMAIIALAAWRAGRRLLPVVLVSAHALVSIAILFGHPRTNVFEAPARVWIARLNGQLAVDLNTRRHLALIPSAQVLPGLEANRAYWLRLSLTGCAASKPFVIAAGQRFEIISVQASSQPHFPALQSPLELCVYRRHARMERQQSRRSSALPTASP